MKARAPERLTAQGEETMPNREIPETVRGLAEAAAHKLFGGKKMRSIATNMIARAIQSGIEADRQGRDDGLREALHEARLQIEYLHEKFVVTGSGNGVLARIDAALSAHAPASEDGWCFDMDKAPRDGTQIILFFPTYREGAVGVYRWNDNDGETPDGSPWENIDGFGCSEGEDGPTAWRHLPTPPIPAKREEDTTHG